MHSEHTVERPFAVELDHWLWRDGLLTQVGDDVLAGVVAFGGTVPEEELVQQWNSVLAMAVITFACLNN